MTATTTRRAGSYVGPYAALVNHSASRNGIDPWLLAALLWVESKFNPHAVSKTGDYGIAQINLASHPTVTAAEAHNPHFAIPWAARYLAELKRSTGSTKGALRAYNTGSGAPSPAGNRYAAAVLNARTQARTASRRLTAGGSALSAAGYQGVDQGVDFTRAGYVPSLAAGKITDVGRETDIEGTPGRYVIERLTSGPHRGQFVYIAENFRPSVHRGQLVTAGQVIGRDLGNTPQGGPGIEIGFNRTARGWDPVAPLPAKGQPTAAGNQMLAYLKRRGLNVRGGVHGTGGAGGASYNGPRFPGSNTYPGGPGSPYWGLTTLPGVKQVAGAYDTAKAFGELAAKILSDPGYIVLWIGFAIVGLAFIFLGIERLLGRSAGQDARALPLVGGVA